MLRTRATIKVLRMARASIEVFRMAGASIEMLRYTSFWLKWLLHDEASLTPKQSSEKGLLFAYDTVKVRPRKACNYLK